MTLHCAPPSLQFSPENQMVFNTSSKHLHHLALQNRLLWPKSNICKIVHVTFEKLRVMSCQKMSSPQLLTTGLPAGPTQSWVHWILDFKYWDVGIFFHICLPQDLYCSTSVLQKQPHGSVFLRCTCRPSPPSCWFASFSFWFWFSSPPAAPATCLTSLTAAFCSLLLSRCPKNPLLYK